MQQIHRRVDITFASGDEPHYNIGVLSLNKGKEILIATGFRLGDVAKWIRRGSAKPLFGGSNPPVASIFKRLPRRPSEKDSSQ